MTEQERLEKEAMDCFGHTGEPERNPEHEDEMAWVGDLGCFTGTDEYHRHWLGGVYTDGVAFLAKKAKSYWLIDAIESWQTERAVRREPFQAWTLKVKDSVAQLICTDGNHRLLAKQEIEYTDFPIPEIKLFRSNNVLMLRSEY